MHDPGDRWSAFLQELKRRRVVRLGLAYAGGGFVLLQGLQLLVEAAILTPPTFRLLALLLIAGLPAALLLGWFFDFTREGVQLAGPDGSAGRTVARLRPRTALAGAAALVALGAAGVALWPAATASAPAAPVEEGEAIAILPFTASGAGMGSLEQGLTDLLARSLDGVGTIRVADPRTVLARWKVLVADGVASPEDKLSIAAETNARSYLTGSVVAAGSQVRISADLFGLDGTRLAGAQVDGPTGQMLALVDSLSLGLLREILRSTRPLPEMDVAALTSSDLQAVRAFLAGERFYRAAAWDQALSSFREAAQRDTLFALAFYRAASAASWSGNQGMRRWGMDAVVRMVARLPEREQTLVRADALRLAGNRAAAVDTVSAYLERYPDDVEATFLMADDLYHLQTLHAPLAGAPPEDALWLFDRTLELDPAFTPALIHPLEVAFGNEDAALATRYLGARLDRVPAVDREALAVYRAGLRALQNPRDAAAIRAGLERALSRRARAGGLQWRAHATVVDPLLRLAAVLPLAERATVAGALRAARSRGGDQRAVQAHVELLVSGGRLAEAREVLRRAMVERSVDRATAAGLARLPVLAGYSAAPLLAVGDSVPGGAQAVSLLLGPLDRGDAAGVRAALRSVAALPLRDTTLRASLARVGGGFARALAGDTARGLREVEVVLDSAGFVPGTGMEAVWLRWLDAAARHPHFRARAMAVLARPWPGRPVYEVPRRLALARALAAAGRPAEAAAERRGAAVALEGADAGILLRR